MRSPHIMGLECARPGMGIFQSTFPVLSMSHLTGAAKPSATPLPWAPRNDGQFCWANKLLVRQKQINDTETEYLFFIKTSICSQG